MKDSVKSEVIKSLIEMINGEVSNKLRNSKKKDKKPEEVMEIEITSIEPLKKKSLSDLRKRLGMNNG